MEFQYSLTSILKLFFIEDFFIFLGDICIYSSVAYCFQTLPTFCWSYWYLEAPGIREIILFFLHELQILFSVCFGHLTFLFFSLNIVSDY